MFARYVVFDTPGQIEVFTWSASGSMITEALVYILIYLLTPLSAYLSKVKGPCICSRNLSSASQSLKSHVDIFDDSMIWHMCSETALVLIVLHAHAGCGSLRDLFLGISVEQILSHFTMLHRYSMKFNRYSVRQTKQEAQLLLGDRATRKHATDS